MILDDDGYRRVGDKSELQQGDIVVYQDGNGEVSHVGIVASINRNVTAGDWDVTILSQWGRDGEYFHRADDVNPLLGSPTEYWTDRI